MTSSSSADRGFLRSARLVSALTLVSRVLGLFRDAATAHLLGAGMVNDALTYAWTVPNAFRRLFGEGALSSAFVPVFTRVLHERGREAARAVANQVISAVGLGLLTLALALVVAAGLIPDDWLSALVGTGELEKARLTVAYTQLLLPYLAVICVIAQFMAVLNSLEEFAVPSFSPVILNLVWLVGIAVAAGWGSGDELPGEDLRARQGFVIVAAILVASLVQFAWHLPCMGRLGVGFRPVRPVLGPELRDVLGAMGPMLLGMGAAQLNVLADRTIALAALPDGGTTHLYYAMRVMQFPLGLVTMALVTTVYPALARLVSREDHQGVAATASLALRTNLLIAVPAGAGLALLAGPIVTLLFEGGEFGAEATRPTALALTGYALGVPFAGTVMLLTRASYAAGDLALPVRVGLGMVVVNVALDLALVGPLGELGLALATTLSAAASAGLLWFGVRRRLGGGALPGLAGGSLPILVVVALMALGVVAVDMVLADLVPPGRPGAALRVPAGLVVGLSLFALGARRLCPDAWSELSSLWSRD